MPSGGASPGTDAVRRRAVGWRKTGGPWFGNQPYDAALRGDRPRLRLEQAQAERDGTTALRTVTDRELA